jgi:tetratricopeptide (TPR) repeat protein
MGSAAELDALRWRHEADRLLGRDDAWAALLTYDKALALDPFVYACWLGKGRALEALGHVDAALDRYDIAANLAPHSFAAHEAKGLLLHKRGAFDDALACFEWASLVAERHAFKAAWALNYRGATLIRLGRLDEALACCDAGLELYRMAVLWLTRGNALRNLQRFDEAIASHNQALVLDPRCGVARFNRGLVEEDQGRMRAAIRSYKQCLHESDLDSALEQRVRRRLAHALRTCVR